MNSILLNAVGNTDEVYKSSTSAEALQKADAVLKRTTIWGFGRSFFDTYSSYIAIRGISQQLISRFEFDTCKTASLD